MYDILTGRRKVGKNGKKITEQNVLKFKRVLYVYRIQGRFNITYTPLPGSARVLARTPRTCT